MSRCEWTPNCHEEAAVFVGGTTGRPVAACPHCAVRVLLWDGEDPERGKAPPATPPVFSSWDWKGFGVVLALALASWLMLALALWAILWPFW